MNCTWFCVNVEVLTLHQWIGHSAPIYRAQAANCATWLLVLLWARLCRAKQRLNGFQGSSSICIVAKNQGSPEETFSANSCCEFNDATQYKQEVEEAVPWQPEQLQRVIAGVQSGCKMVKTMFIQHEIVQKRQRRQPKSKNYVLSSHTSPSTYISSRFHQFLSFYDDSWTDPIKLLKLQSH